MSRTQRLTLAATSLGLFMIYLDALIVNVALPAIQSDFKVGEAGLQWVVTAYSLGMAISVMSAGTAADIYGRRKLYLGGIALFTAASAACGMAFSLEVLNLARAVQGVAAAMANVTSLALLSAAFPDQKSKAWAIGIWTALASTAMAIGPTLGGFMVQETGWRSIFMVNVPVGLAVLALTWRFVAESRDERPRTFDIPGQLLFMTAVGAFVFAVIEGPQAGWLSGAILALFVVAGGGAGGIYLLGRQARGPDDGPEALPRPHVLARDRRDLRRVFHRVRDGARDHAVPAERARFLAHECRVGPGVVQRDPDDGVADGGQTRGGGWLAAADSPRPRVADDRARRPDSGAAGGHNRRQRGPRLPRRRDGIVSDADYLARDDGGSGRALGNGIRHHERTARARFHCRVRRPRLDPRGRTSGDPQRPPRRCASGSDRARGSHRGDHPQREPPRLPCRDRARPTDPTSRRRHAGGDPCGRRERLHRGHPLQPRNGHGVPRPRPRRRLCLVSRRQGFHR